ncbi:MlaD family protein [Caenimonas koreensis]|uniref:MCE family protein n=1 Tax=Caenimonas koreensis DSM 17982 TaxID=1121255 RepID=A0A844B6G5_9BURK|nr:MlaD family protein [Caenimonas koreensis]MRD48783.1 MCE family protein [Caenimonas koreensis DSM 17982]
MENKAHALAAGIFVVAVTALLVMLAAWLTRDTGERDTYEISTRETVSGLQSQAAVRYRGVDVGKVSAISFDPKAVGNVLIRLEVDHEAPVTTETFAQLSYQGVTGLAFVQLDDSGKAAKRLGPDNANPPRIPLRPSLLSKLSSRGEEILDKVEKAVTRVNQVLDEPNQKKFAVMLDNLGIAAGDASQLARRLDNTVTKGVDPAIAEARTTMKSLQGTADEVGKTAADFGKTARRLNEKDGPIDRIAQGTESLSHAADSFNASTLPRVNRVTEDTSRAVRQLGRAANSIRDNPQSLIYGNGPVEPGPGEPGFTPPGSGK